jgi:quercetin dioxygenase-like cupin family protein
MDTEKFRLAVITKVYHIPANRDVAMHRHPGHDELFYCIKGSGFGVLKDREVPLSPGKVFVVPAGTMHSLKTESDLYVTSSLIPLADHPDFDTP